MVYREYEIQRIELYFVNLLISQLFSQDKTFPENKDETLIIVKLLAIEIVFVSPIEGTTMNSA